MTKGTQVTASHSRRHLLGGLAVIAGAAITLSACDAAPTGRPGDNAGGPSVPYDATVEEWQAAFDEAFADREDIEIVWQTSTVQASLTAVTWQAAADRIEEYSNGHISVEMAWFDSVTSMPEGTEGLQDGRLDMYAVGTFIRPEIYPVVGVIAHEAILTRGPSVVADTYSNSAAIVETLWNTPEAVAEFEEKGFAVLNPMRVSALNVLACSEPWTSLDDLRGKQIRVASQIQASQVEALGGVPVTVIFNDLYEALQRGIVDCMIAGLSLMVQFPGMTELAPYLIAPESAAFGTNTNSEMFNSRWPELPLVAQQLVFDTIALMDVENLTYGISRDVISQYEQVEAAGGQFLDFEDDVNEALAAVTEATVAAWADNPAIDGTAFTERLAATREKWDALVVEAGYSDAPFSEVDEWLTPELDSGPFEDLYFEHVVVPHRPS